MGRPRLSRISSPDNRAITGIGSTSGSQNAGTYTVTWDGSDASGVRMAPGVYFLKSKVGGDQIVNRLIYVSR